MALADGDVPRTRTAVRTFAFTRFRYESVVALAGLAIVWQIVSLFVPHFLFPSVPEIAARLVAIFTSWNSIFDIFATSARILAGLAGAFVCGTLLAVPMARSPAFERYVYPLLNFNQGIPALSWEMCIRDSSSSGRARAPPGSMRFQSSDPDRTWRTPAMR